MAIDRKAKSKNKVSQEKEWRKLQREKDKLDKASWNAPLIELAEPYQRGWIRAYKVRDQDLNRKDAHVFKEVLKHCNSYLYSRRKDFMTKDYKTKKMVPVAQVLSIFGDYEFNKLALTPKIKSFFQSQTYFYQGRYARYHKEDSYTKWAVCPLRVFHFEYKLEPHMITHTKAIIPEVESRLDEIEKILWAPDVQGKLWGTHKDDWDYRCEELRKGPPLSKDDIQWELRAGNNQIIDYGNE